MFTRTIRCVEVLYRPDSSVDEKNVASGFLQDLQSSENYYQVAIMIMQSKNPSWIQLVFLTM